MSTASSKVSVTLQVAELCTPNPELESSHQGDGVRLTAGTMLQILNKTRLKAALTLILDQRGAEKVSVAVKGTFAIPPRGQEVRLAEEQVAPLPVEVHLGDPGKSSLKYPADLIPGKLRTDVLLIGTARSPRSRPVTRLEACVRVGPLAKRVVITGDRRWKKRAFGLGFGMTHPTPFREMPIVYERAFGGEDQTDRHEKKRGWDGRNPVGTGFRLNRHAVNGTPVPNIEDPDHVIKSWKEKPPVAGFGPIDGVWEPRSRFAGTYDEKWQAKQAPLLPSDFDLRFFDTAPEGLVAEGFLRGGEPVELVNLSQDERVAFRLPLLDVGLALHLGNAVDRQSADLWSVILEPDEQRFCMVWGGSFSAGKQPSQAYGIEVDVDGPMKKDLAANDGA